MAHIYKITNPQGKIYIGSTTNVIRRFKDYKAGKCQSQRKLYASLLKYGSASHRFEIITECVEAEMFQMESVYGHMYDVLGKKGLNCALPKNGDYYKKIDESTRIKRIENQTGKKHSQLTKNKMSDAKKGVKFSEDHRKKLSDAHRGPRGKYKKAMGGA